MARRDDIHALPADLPVPTDDGARGHLPGPRLPPIALPSTDGSAVELTAPGGRTVVYLSPPTGRPDQAPPPGWNEIPGARRRTPRSCAHRDRHAELGALGARVFGPSTRETAHQREAAERLRLPFPLPSDADLAFRRAPRLPTFEVAGMTLLERLPMIVADGRIERAHYPVVPPDADAGRGAAWLAAHLRGASKRPA